MIDVNAIVKQWLANRAVPVVKPDNVNPPAKPHDEGPPIIVPRSEPDPGCVSAEFRDPAETDDSGAVDQSPEARKKRAFEDFFREDRKRKPYPSQRGWGRYW